ncbi:MAG: YabP/YqfC family sporulation protein [Clostridium sp.]|nr:YabP/YqfC family sporulation protein [Clostridium sp.]MCM1398855.1 YabP/YqfC family sporulation protein [Clostridium sp.]MCM1458514.1 YabP/YqfC family sporulation protein [Bacteroides sp.]
MTRVTLVDQKKVYIDGYKTVVSIDDNKIVIDCKNKLLEINGSNLSILLFTGIEMTVAGFISSIAWKY